MEGGVSVDRRLATETRTGKFDSGVCSAGDEGGEAFSSRQHNILERGVACIVRL